MSSTPTQPIKKPADYSREKGGITAGAILFSLLRTLDVPFQCWLLSSGTGVNVIRRIGGTPIPTPSSASINIIPALSAYQALIFGLAVGSALKQVYWCLLVRDVLMPVGFGSIAAMVNAVMNSTCTILSLWSLTSQQPTDMTSIFAFLCSASPALLIGIPLYVGGLFVEWYSEIQRKNFKALPENKDKPYSGGLFGYARNINYGGYMLWRAGYGLACGGWGAGIVFATFFARDFVIRAIPSMDEYCRERYGEQWEEIRRKVPYTLLPWIH